MKDYLTLMSELSESTAVTFGKPLRASGTLEGKSVTLDILRGAEEIGTIRADFDVHGIGATSRAQGYQVISGYSVEYIDQRLQPHQSEDGVQIGGPFASAAKALAEVKRRVAARIASLGGSVEGIRKNTLPSLRERLRSDPKAAAFMAYVETVLPQMAAGQPIVPPSIPYIVGVGKLDDTRELWQSVNRLIRAINYLSALKGESAFASQMKKLRDELKQLVQLGGMDKSPAEVANMAVHGMARLNKIRSMLEQA